MYFSNKALRYPYNSYWDQNALNREEKKKTQYKNSCFWIISILLESGCVTLDFFVGKVLLQHTFKL